MRRFSGEWIRHNIRHARRRSDWYWRRATANSRVLPDFLIIGAMKGGTTSLYDYLCQHPKVVAAYQKEVHFFDTDHFRGATWYRAFFPTRSGLASIGPGARAGEATPYYLFHPACAQRIAAMLPDVQLVAVLRDPVDRAISHYHHSVRIGMDTRPIRQAFAEEAAVIAAETPKVMIDTYESDRHRMWSYVSRGHYADQLQQYYRYFRRDQILVRKSEELFSNPQPAVDAVTDFLGLPPVRLQNVEILNAGTYSKSPDPEMVEVRESLRRYFRPLNQQLSELLGADFTWED